MMFFPSRSEISTQKYNKNINKYDLPIKDSRFFTPNATYKYLFLDPAAAGSVPTSHCGTESDPQARPSSTPGGLSGSGNN